MPLYGFFCANGHETEKFFSASSRPKSVECDTCCQKSKYRPSVGMSQSLTVTRHGERRRIDESNKRQSDKSYVWRDIRCSECSHEDIEDVDLVDGEVPKSVSCVNCGAVAEVCPVKVNIDRFSERFPYYDRGLGVMLQSKQHRRDICRERGLTPVDGDWDIEREYSKWDTQNEKEEKEYADYCERLDTHPGFREFRRKQDLGIL